MKIKEIKLGDLFYNNKFVIVFSILLSTIIWFYVTINSTDVKPVTISDIPVNITLSDSAQNEGLRVFGADDLKAEVSVIGSRIVVGQIKKSDIQVTAQQALTITSPGNYTLELTAKKASLLTNYEFSSVVSPKFVTVKVDKYREVEFPIEDAIQYKSDPEYFASSTVFSSSTVTLSGPESEVSKVERVVAEGEISSLLQKTKTINVPLVMYDSHGDVVSSDDITMSIDKVDATIPILMKKVMPIKAVFTNQPEGFEFPSGAVKIEPSEIEIAAPKEIFDTIEYVNLEPLDFSKIGMNNNSFDLMLDLPAGSKNLSNVYTIGLSINMSGMSSITGTLQKFEFLNLPQDKAAKVNTSYLYVNIIGPWNEISRIRSSDLVGYIDMKDKESFEGNTEMVLDIKVNNYSSCWAYGDYKVNIQVLKK